jgi:hypothetical protein
MKNINEYSLKTLDEAQFILCYHKLEGVSPVVNIPAFFKTKEDLLDFVCCCKKEELKNNTICYVFYFAGQVSNHFYVD